MVSRWAQTWSGNGRRRSSWSRHCLQRHIDIGDGAPKGRGIGGGQGRHVVRLWPGQFVDLANVDGGT